MSTDYDVIVAGLGAMGSATAAHLATKHVRVLGLDKFHPPHNLGSSHVLSRIIREAYFEHPSYVPLVQRAYALWTALEQESSRKLLWSTGGLMLGHPGSVLVAGARRSAELHKLEHKFLSAVEVHRQFPCIQPSAEMVAVWEPRAGVLFPEAAIKTQLDRAARDGAVFKFDQPVLKWEPIPGRIRVHTVPASYTAKQLILSSGAWLRTLVPELNLPLTVERQALFWFEPKSDPEWFRPEACPIYICEYEPRRFFYGFPDMGDGVKIGIHHEGARASPDSLDRVVHEEEIEAARRLLHRFLPRAAGVLKASAVCMYTNTPDEHFLLDFHPKFPQVLLVSPCSGHGFKFAPVIGEIVADLISGEKPTFDLSLFKLSRLRPGPGV